ncbi:MAG: CHAP domain-containing protein [Treponema sp.]|jgi:hypothetical protein|nr:CHAP domain-containing protein [Treponema sp.]
MNFSEFIKAYLGKEVDFDGHYKGQCVDLFRQYCKDVLGIDQPAPVAGAVNFWENYETDPALKNNFTKIENTPAGVPEYGDVMVWNKNRGGGFGHVAIFIEGGILMFTSLDQNWPSLSVVTRTVHNYTDVHGWLRPNKKVGIPGD